ncbi:MAG: hypothetical protein Q7S58_10130 [Candidatus Binatus sp.]|uniref:hypothetical protein n=1 Tax=Candidatus Binatus sp. TaxID=2811406 RepID=UPI00271B05C3|nr:hypothetical protein [Candidatus Binatus sp.]MDO8432750.1 hypothetical protein [Candidatus Binatus sp.]
MSSNAVATDTISSGLSNQNQVLTECASPDPWLSARFEPDFLVPVQYFDLIRRRTNLDGETRLVFAVLEDAVRCYVKSINSPRPGDRARFAEVQRWFHAEAGTHSPFSFEYVCDVLGIEPVALRERLGLMSTDDLPTKQMRSVGRRQVVRSGRASRKRFRRGEARPLRLRESSSATQKI